MAVNYKNDKDDVFSGINIVPFTDIVLVLLIVFMIAAPGIASAGMDVSLPSAGTSSPRLPARVTITLDQQGNLFMENRELGIEELRLRVTRMVQGGAAAGKDKQTTFVLNADMSARHGRVIQVLDLLRSSGARDIYVGTQKK